MQWRTVKHLKNKDDYNCYIESYTTIEDGKLVINYEMSLSGHIPGKTLANVNFLEVDSPEDAINRLNALTVILNIEPLQEVAEEDED